MLSQRAAASSAFYLTFHKPRLQKISSSLCIEESVRRLIIKDWAWSEWLVKADELQEILKQMRNVRLDPKNAIKDISVAQFANTNTVIRLMIRK